MTAPILITGATAGLGRATAFALARAQHPVLLVVRDAHRGELLARSLREASPGASVEVRHADLSDLSSVRALSADLIRAGLLPKAVVCNAGLQVLDGIRRSVDGVELTMATNVLGHVALLAPLLDRLSPGARVVTLGSETHRGGPRAFGFPAARWQAIETLLRPPADVPTGARAGQVRYSTSKLACIAMAYEIDRRWAARGVRAVSFDPGLMPATGLAREYHPVVRALYARLTPLLVRLPGARTVEASAADLAWIAGSAEAEPLMGHYVAGRRARRSSALSHRDGLGAEVWDACVELADASAERAPDGSTRASRRPPA